MSEDGSREGIPLFCISDSSRRVVDTLHLSPGMRDYLGWFFLPTILQGKRVRMIVFFSKIFENRVDM